MDPAYTRSSIGKWKLTSNMTYRRAAHSAPILAHRQVLIIGGKYNDDSLFSAQLYDSQKNRWSPVAIVPYTRVFHAQSVLPNGTVLIADGIMNSNILISEPYIV